MCASYPEILLFPFNADDTTIVESSKFRSSHRLPTFTYYDKVCKTSIWRSSQPKTGVWSRSKHDEELLKIIGKCNGHDQNKTGTLTIYDARPELNAQANRVKGGGYESCGLDANY